MKAYLALMALTCSLFAKDIVTYKQMSLELSTKIAQDALTICRDSGYQVSSVIVDRSGNLQVALRDVYASSFTTEIAQRKANAAILAGTGTGAFRASHEDIRQELNHINGIILIDGGFPIVSNGIILGAIGISGTPSGAQDAACAEAALKHLA